MTFQSSQIEIEDILQSRDEDEQCQSLDLANFSSNTQHSLEQIPYKSNHLKRIPSSEVRDEDNESEGEDDLQKVIKNPLIKKQIAKLFKSQSKKFTKKQIMIVPNYSMMRELSTNQLITLFGCLEVETYYKDYEDPYHNDLILYLERMHAPVYMLKDFKLSMVDIVMQPISNSGIVDFEFLIDRFIRMHDQNYLEMAKELAVYQYKVKNHLIPQMNRQKSKLQKSQKKKEDFASAQQDFVKYFKEYLHKETDTSSFYDYELYRSNYMTGDIELFQSGFSFSLSSLLGVEVDQVENLIFRGQNYFNEQSGEFRLKLFLFVMKAINNEMQQSEPFPFVLRTYDGIVINCKAYLEYVSYENRPSWIDQDDMYGIIFRFDINVNQIKAILEIRSKQNNIDLESTTNASVPNSVEYQMYSEIFIEKFYPELFDSVQVQNLKSNDDKNNKSLLKITDYSKKGIRIS